MARGVKRLARNSEVLQDRATLEQHVLLEGTGQAPARYEIGTALTDGNSVDQDFPARRREPPPP